MSSLVAYISLVLISVSNATYGKKTLLPNQGCRVNLNISSENDGDIKIIPSIDSEMDLKNRTIFIKPTTTPAPTVFKPIPMDLNETSSSEATVVEELGSVTLPNVVELPPPATPESQGNATFCGKLGNCYQWFDDEWALKLNGYKSCEPRDERRAKRYCCVPTKN